MFSRISQHVQRCSLVGIAPRLAGPARTGLVQARSDVARRVHSVPVCAFIFRTPEDLEEQGRIQKASTGTWESHRYVTRGDGLGFSFHRTTMKAGTATQMCYKNHVEAVFVMGGKGEIEVLAEGQQPGQGTVYPLERGSFYALNGQEHHVLRAAADSDLECTCAFNPPVAGTEDHNEDGVYPAVGDDGEPMYEYGPEEVAALFKPAESLVNGSRGK